LETKKQCRGVVASRHWYWQCIELRWTHGPHLLQPGIATYASSPAPMILFSLAMVQGHRLPSRLPSRPLDNSYHELWQMIASQAVVCILPATDCTGFLLQHWRLASFYGNPASCILPAPDTMIRYWWQASPAILLLLPGSRMFLSSPQHFDDPACFKVVTSIMATDLVEFRH
jgi:hypothetical protein